MNIILVQPEMNWHHPYCEAPSRALLTLGTLAEQEGHKVKVLHLDIDKVDMAAEVKEFKADIVGLTVNTFQVRSARQVTKQIREVSRDIRIVVGGPHAVVWDGEADKVVIGEGDNQWLEYLGSSRRINSLDELPMVDYDLINPVRFSGVFPIGGIPSMMMMSSRGCGFGCIFCNTPLFWGRRVRYRDPVLVVDEVAYLNKRFGVAEVFFQDDTFNLNHGWANGIFEEIIRRRLNNKMVFKLACRVNEKLVTEPFLEMARRAGVWNIFYGVESGSQRLLDHMKKGITVPEIKRAFSLTHRYGMQTQASFIVGMPGENLESLQETQALIYDLMPEHMGWVYACPFPHTEFDKEVTAKGHKRDFDYADYRYGLVICRTDELDYDLLESFPGYQVRNSVMVGGR